MLRALLAAACCTLMPITAWAQDELPLPPPPPPPSSSIDCPQACGPGSRCEAGTCVSACNPICPGGQQCLDNGTCVPVPSGPPPMPLPAEGSVVNDEGERAPPGMHWELQRRKGLLITGPILFGVGYLLGAYTGLIDLANSNNGDHLWNFLPIFGPVAAKLVLLADHSVRSLEFTDLFFPVIFTGLQVAGIVLTVFGIRQHQALVPDSEYERSPREGGPPPPPPVQWSLAPGAPGAPIGLSLLVWN